MLFAFAGIRTRLKALWSARLAYQMSHLPAFEVVFRAVRRTLRQVKLP